MAPASASAPRNKTRGGVSSRASTRSSDARTRRHGFPLAADAPTPSLTTLVEMLDAIADDRQPGVLAFLVDRIFRRRKAGVGKGADRHGDHIGIGPGLIIDGRPAKGAEMKDGDVAAVGDRFPGPLFARYRHVAGFETRLEREGRSAAPLTMMTMANRNAERLARAGDGQLPATAARNSLDGHSAVLGSGARRVPVALM